MEIPSILWGDSLKRLLHGAAAGPVVAMIVGFNWGVSRYHDSRSHNQ